jgi:hypothetical protein
MFVATEFRMFVATEFRIIVATEFRMFVITELRMFVASEFRMFCLTVSHLERKNYNMHIVLYFFLLLCVSNIALNSKGLSKQGAEENSGSRCDNK